MKLFNFDYTKKDGTKSERKVMSLHSSDKWVDGIDLDKLNEEEVKKLKEIQLTYEQSMQPFYKKAFRRFLHEGMRVTYEETIKE